ncbi:hypothetical protein B4U80_01327 [Leptotrombidium deliense]|uniref:Uncharacterized protein n=1 Tax=Leptotrombidium deliense TaxID=299467 RepID=A0A443S5T4_9ACAR|nr:hypothetical protein B4U80_01327 [Leptotrombidium deliense]
MNRILLSIFGGSCFLVVFVTYPHLSKLTPLTNSHVTQKNEKLNISLNISFNNLSTLKFFINEMNENQIIHNEQIFNSFKVDDTIIAIQVHNRSDYLKITIDALEKLL